MLPSVAEGDEKGKVMLMKNKNKILMEFTKAVLMVMLLLVMSTIATVVNVSATAYRDEDPTFTPWTNPPPNIYVGWTTDKAMATHKGGMPCFDMFWRVICRMCSIPGSFHRVQALRSVFSV